MNRRDTALALVAFAAAAAASIASVARAQGLRLPQSVLVRADEVIE